jgi:hypothetical protein
MLVPTLVSRSAEQLWESTLPSLGQILLNGGVPALATPAVVLALPNLVINGLADHPQQSALELHYSVPTLALVWLSVPLGLEQLGKLVRDSNRRRIMYSGVGALLVAGSLAGFISSSPYAPGESRPRLDAEHIHALRQAIALIPAGASVEAQSSLLPHVSHRRDVFEFPDRRVGEYLILDATLPVSGQSYKAGFERERTLLGDDGYQLIYSQESVQLFRRTP